MGHGHQDAEASASPEREWFKEHFVEGPTQIVDFLDGDGISIEGLRVADFGSGDGIIDLGLMLRARPGSLTGFDVQQTDPAALLARARAEGVAEELPPGLEFLPCEQDRVPAPDASFDYVVSWSTFEHVVDPKQSASEIHRILRPGGGLFLQLYPFYRSAPGSHLWTWFPEGFVQLTMEPDEIEALVAADPGRSDDEWREDRLADFRSLNGVTVDGLQDAILAAGLVIAKVEFVTSAFHVPRELLHHRLTDLGITGIKLLAYRPL